MNALDERLHCSYLFGVYKPQGISVIDSEESCVMKDFVYSLLFDILLSSYAPVIDNVSYIEFQLM